MQEWSYFLQKEMDLLLFLSYFLSYAMASFVGLSSISWNFETLLSYSDGLLIVGQLDHMAQEYFSHEYEWQSSVWIDRC